VLIDIAISGFRNMIKKDAKKILKYKHLTTEIKLTWNVKKIPILIIKGNWKHNKIIQKICQRHTGKARHQETTKTAYLALRPLFGKY
jgi:hypothetical protein